MILVAVIAAGPVLVVLTFLATRALVSGDGRRGPALAGLAATLLALAAYLAMGMGGLTSYSDTACARHRPAGFDEGSSWTQSAGYWPPGLRCRFESRSGEMTTYEADFDVLWVTAAMTTVFAATMGLFVIGVRSHDSIVHSAS